MAVNRDGTTGWIGSSEPASYSVTLADGRALPDWLAPGGKGLYFGQRPANVERIELRVVATFADGTSMTRYITIDTVSGELEPLPDKHAVLDMPRMFSRQFAAAEPIQIDSRQLSALLAE